MARWMHWLFHSWHLVHDTGVTVYEECAVCGKRRAWQRRCGGVQPIDKKWVTGEANFLCIPVGKR